MDRKRNPNAKPLCPACGENYGEHGYYCKPCFNAYVRARRMLGHDATQARNATKEYRQGVKERLVAAKGGQCVRCGYLGDTPAKRAALHFHHRGRVYAFRLSTSIGRSQEKLDAELEKCDLLCSNCHIVEHYGTKVGVGRPRKPVDRRVQYFLDQLALGDGRVKAIRAKRQKMPVANAQAATQFLAARSKE